MSAPTTGEITVRRCVVHVVRRGGWSWGPDPRGLVQRVLDALPELLAAEFDEYLTGEGPDLEITEPVRLSVRLSAPGGGGLVPAGLVVEPVAGSPREPIPPPVPVTAPPSAEPSTLDQDALVADIAEPTVAALFEELAVRGELAALLGLLPEETVRTYLSALLAATPGERAGSSNADTDERIGSVVAGDFAGPVAELAAELARRRSLPWPPATRADLARLLEPPRGADATPPAAEGPVETVTGSPRPAGEVRVGSVLPFLLAGPLARTGYLDAIGPALSGVDLLAEAPLFAAALAYKVLGAPQRGWRRAPGDDVVAAAFAGLESVPDLTTFARRVAPALPVLDGVLALSLCRGHSPAGPLLVAGVDDGLLLIDGEGLFPVAWASTVEGLLPHWEACGRPPVLVRAGPLPPTCLRDLAAAGVRFITDARPVRDEPLTRLRWRTPLWTTGGVEPRLAADFPGERVDELVRTVFVEHRAVPLAADRALDRGVALAASLALGMVAGQLWGGDTPVLALTRFADLEATVRFTRDAVRVKIPLGRRHTDLWRGGALTDVPNVVWLGGRTLTFSGG
ncbi:hypothetical protein SAMN05421837_101123 [Amycolatopsis pretoriensis]|uniref:Uncharacterized protein n=1 Tax=Amycolatopsis pretoriensis TaxID=218821 RepID=A0A1H5Q339_9PSEU|nr:hypothetical protein [Amycolatopsis pretoriensis]SEF19841.1 hypothetical protein SAMN05421837_101123 [Amycolatopsis pretoriensis]